MSASVWVGINLSSTFVMIAKMLTGLQFSLFMWTAVTPVFLRSLENFPVSKAFVKS